MLTKKLYYLANPPLQMEWGRLQVVGFSRATHRRMRHDQYFATRFKSAPYDTITSMWHFISENQTNSLNLEQNVFTKSQNAAWERIIIKKWVRKVFRKFGLVSGSGGELYFCLSHKGYFCDINSYQASPARKMSQPLRGKEIGVPRLHLQHSILYAYFS